MSLPHAASLPGIDPARPTLAPEAIAAAAGRLAGRVHRTPLLASATAARAVESATGVRLAGERVHFKAEHLQKTGSFKPRGAFTRLDALSAEERGRGVITISAGNHAQAVAYAASFERIPVTVVMPEGAVRSKVAAAAGYGAEVVLHGTDVGETLRRMEELRAERGLTLVHPFDDPWVIAGQGTVGLEIAEDLPDVDVVVVGVGGGGLISGIATAARAARPAARIYGVEPEGSDALARALAAGRPVTLQPRSIADGLGAPFAGEWTLAIVQRLVEGIVVVDDATIVRGMRFAAERMKQLLEPAGAAALGALLAGKVPLRDGETVCVVLSGGNVDLPRFAELVMHAVG